MNTSAPVLKSKQRVATAERENVLEAVRLLLRSLPVSEQELVLAELSDALRPIPVPRAGPVLGSVVRLLPQKEEWAVSEIKQQVEAEGTQASNKEIYNALGYLTRKGHVRRLGYGRYYVNGAVLETSEDLGGEPTRDEAY